LCLLRGTTWIFKYKLRYSYFGVPLSVSLHQSTILIFVYMLPLSEGQTGQAWEPLKIIKASSETGEHQKSLPCLRQLVTGVASPKPGFDPGPVLLRFVMDRIAVGLVFLRILRGFPVTTISPMVRTHLHPHTAVSRRTSGRGLESFKHSCPLSDVGGGNSG
jgi:hypothetical protein